MTTLPTPPSLPLRQNVSTTMPAIGGAIAWRSWPAGLDEARRRRVPILVVAEPAWTTSAQRLALVLGSDERLRQACEETVVPVLADPFDQDTPQDRWRAAAVALSGTIGPPLILVLTDEGAPVVSYSGMAFEGDGELPSLASVVLAAAEAWEQSREAVEEDGRRLAARIEAIGSGEVPDVAAWWAGIGPLLDTAHGGLHEAPKHPRPDLLRFALGHDDDSRAWAETTLNRLLRGGIADQLDRGFHRCARDGRWVTPHFEKPVPLNANLAAVYAQAATVFGRDDFRRAGRDLAVFCEAALRQQVDAVAAESTYYTWTSKEVQEGVDRATLQPVSLHYNIVPGTLRQALHQAVPADGLGAFSHLPAGAMEGMLEQGKAQLRAARRRRPSPPLESVPAASWRAETVRWLFQATTWDADIATGRSEDALRALVTNPAGTSLPDQAALLQALLAAHAQSGEEGWRTAAVARADSISAQLLTGPGTLRDGNGISLAVFDDMVPAAIGNVVDGFQALAAITGDAGYRNVSRRVAVAYGPAAAAAGPWAASFWDAVHGLGEPDTSVG